MKKKTVRAGIVGAGFSASFHFEAIRKVYGTNVEIKGVHALQGAQAYAEKRGVAVYDSLEKLIDDVDVIHCCTTASSHESVAIAALERDKFAIVEKPLTGFFGDGSEEVFSIKIPNLPSKSLTMKPGWALLPGLLILPLVSIRIGVGTWIMAADE